MQCHTALMHSPNLWPAVLSEDWQNAGFGIYVHWPFCQSKCPYCDFNSHVAQNVDQDRWAKAYVSELKRHAALTPGRVVQSVFFGGGTPSLMEPETVDAVISTIRHLWPQANDLEITLEANPGSVEANRFKGYARAGVNRVSMGFQALNNHDLAKLGRLHTVDEALRAFDVARSHFERVSFDLIYARQDQTLNEWKSELKQALALAVDHLSLYQLTVEDGTAFGDRYKRGKLRGLPDPDLAADMYEITQKMCTDSGFECYEVSNHAREGARSKHNSLYWRYGDYVGIGPGAHGRLTLNGQRHATEAFIAPGEWLKHAEAGSGDLLRDQLRGSEQAQEYLLMGLRLREGIDLRRFAQMNGSAMDERKINQVIDLNLLTRVCDQIFVTKQGRMLLNAVLDALLAD